MNTTPDAKPSAATIENQEQPTGGLARLFYWLTGHSQAVPILVLIGFHFAWSTFFAFSDIRNDVATISVVSSVYGVVSALVMGLLFIGVLRSGIVTKVLVLLALIGWATWEQTGPLSAFLWGRGDSPSMTFAVIDFLVMTIVSLLVFAVAVIAFVKELQKRALRPETFGVAAGILLFAGASTGLTNFRLLFLSLIPLAYLQTRKKIDYIVPIIGLLFLIINTVVSFAGGKYLTIGSGRVMFIVFQLLGIQSSSGGTTVTILSGLELFFALVVALVGVGFLVWHFLKVKPGQKGDTANVGAATWPGGTAEPPPYPLPAGYPAAPMPSFTAKEKPIQTPVADMPADAAGSMSQPIPSSGSAAAPPGQTPGYPAPAVMLPGQWPGYPAPYPAQYAGNPSQPMIPGQTPPAQRLDQPVQSPGQTPSLGQVPAQYPGQFPGQSAMEPAGQTSPAEPSAPASQAAENGEDETPRNPKH